ncbi:hypothetical protein Tco_1282724 [Tanacetum coccineum]
MRTRSQSRRQQQVTPTFVEPFDLEKPNNNQEPPNPPVVTMADNRTMAEMLQAPTEGYEDAIIVAAITYPSIFFLFSKKCNVRRCASSILVCLCFCDDCPGLSQIFKASRARGFCPSFTLASHLQLHYGNPISKFY